jgi:hypothetical protein
MTIRSVVSKYKGNSKGGKDLITASQATDMVTLSRKVQNLRRKLDEAKSPFDVHDIASERNKLEWGFETKLPRAMLDEALSPIDYPALEEARKRLEK